MTSRFCITLLVVLFSLTPLKALSVNPSEARKIAEIVLQAISQSDASRPDFLARQKHRQTQEPEILRALVELEDDALRLLSRHEQAQPSFAAKWQLSQSELFTILAYYGTRLFISDPRRSMNPRRVLANLRQSAHQVFLNEHQSDYESYLHAVTRLSVAEMAQEKQVSEGEILQNLSLYGIDLIGAFNRKPTNEETRQLAEKLFAIRFWYHHVEPGVGALDLLEAVERWGLARETLLQIAEEVLGFGRSALEFVLHHRYVIDENKSWGRSAVFLDRELTELEILVHLKLQDRTLEEVVRVLNHLFADHPGPVRKKSEIAVQLTALALRPARLSSELYDPHYGYLKKAGRLQAVAVFHFMADHRQASDEWLARRLGVSLENFCSFVGTHLRSTASKALLAGSTLFEMYLKQKEALDILVDWIGDPERGRGWLPKQEQFGGRPDQIPLVYARLMSSSQFRETGIFADAGEFWYELYHHARLRGIAVQLTEVQIKTSLSPEMHALLREQALALVLQWIREHHGRLPQTKHFGTRSGEIPLAYSRLVTGRKQAGLSGLFSDRQAFWLELYFYAQARGLMIQLLDVEFRGELSLQLRQLLQQEAVDLITKWILRDGHMRLPKGQDFKEHGGMIPVRYDRLTGQWNYGFDGKLHNSRIFNTPESLNAVLVKRLKFVAPECTSLWSESR